MRVPACFLCSKLLGGADGSFDGGYVKFAEYVEPEDPDDPPFDEPPGNESFCGEHLAAAEALSHLTSREALLQLQQQFGKFEEPDSWDALLQLQQQFGKEPNPPRTRWQRLCDWFWKWI
jgi:hypothetical protein